MIRRAWLSVLCGLALAGFAPAQNSVPERMNVLVLLADDWRHDTLGAANPVVQTPRLDALAREGVRFTRRA